MGAYGALLLGARPGPAPCRDLRGEPARLGSTVRRDRARALRQPHRRRRQHRVGIVNSASIPIWIDCGNSDQLYSATKQFIAQLPNSPAGGFSPVATTSPSGIAAAGDRLDRPLLTAYRRDASSAAANPISRRKWLSGKRIDLISVEALRVALIRSRAVLMIRSNLPLKDNDRSVVASRSGMQTLFRFGADDERRRTAADPGQFLRPTSPSQWSRHASAAAGWSASCAAARSNRRSGASSSASTTALRTAEATVAIDDPQAPRCDREPGGAGLRTGWAPSHSAGTGSTTPSTR